MSGKGSGRRPQKVDEQTFASNWERIFSGRSTAASASGSNPADLGSSPSAPAKHCGSCGHDKPLAEFHRSKRTKDGLNTACKACAITNARRWYANNRERARSNWLSWKERNPDKLAKHYQKKNELERANDDRKLKKRFARRLRASLQSGKGGKHTFDLIGFTLDDLRSHLERQFLPGMGWHNMGEWHIDHIVPLSSFIYASENDEGFKAAWALTNLRPLWAKDNMSKGQKRVTLL